MYGAAHSTLFGTSPRWCYRRCRRRWWLCQSLGLLCGSLVMTDGKEMLGTDSVVVPIAALDCRSAVCGSNQANTHLAIQPIDTLRWVVVVAAVAAATAVVAIVSCLVPSSSSWFWCLCVCCHNDERTSCRRRCCELSQRKNRSKYRPIVRIIVRSPEKPKKRNTTQTTMTMTTMAIVPNRLSLSAL